ncbi:MAG: hypothetical protein ACR2G2_06200 [Pseudonocardia sp.]
MTTTHPTDPHPMTRRTPVTTHNPPSTPSSSGVLVHVTARPLARVEPTARPPVVPDAVVLHNLYPARAWGDRVRLVLVVVGWLAAFAAVAGLVWLTAAAVVSLIATAAAVIAWVGTHWLLCLITTAALLLPLLGGGGSCAGLHCGGCPR